MKIKSLVSSIVVVFGLLALFSSSIALAEDSAASTPTPSLRLRQELKQDVKQFVKESRPEKTPKPTSARQKVCELHIKVIKARETRFAQNGADKLKRLDAISQAVQKFYTERLLPQGKVITNYDSLVADVNAKKAALGPLVDKVKADSESLTCTDDKARGQFQTFKTDAQALLTGVRNYRLSVLNLVKAVKAAAGPAKLSPKPSILPTAVPTTAL